MVVDERCAKRTLWTGMLPGSAAAFSARPNPNGAVITDAAQHAVVDWIPVDAVDRAAVSFQLRDRVLTIHVPNVDEFV